MHFESPLESLTYETRGGFTAMAMNKFKQNQEHLLLLPEESLLPPILVERLTFHPMALMAYTLIDTGIVSGKDRLISLQL